MYIFLANIINVRYFKSFFIYDVGGYYTLNNSESFYQKEKRTSIIPDIR